ncbi:hypothetical protein ACPOL_5065 [Acidisarcina polymorpha]|uniref:Uncharacterized protein n=1 Tax=Acidisarcina polymorpha TaxID=2211140 RepID=A0A2Z5G5F6_9BACT|nr:hypothetical protein ACPOL_5065 [Acidisarcina polymorpha]
MSHFRYPLRVILHLLDKIFFLYLASPLGDLSTASLDLEAAAYSE